MRVREMLFDLNGVWGIWIVRKLVQEDSEK